MYRNYSCKCTYACHVVYCEPKHHPVCIEELLFVVEHNTVDLMKAHTKDSLTPTSFSPFFLTFQFETSPRPHGPDQTAGPGSIKKRWSQSGSNWTLNQFLVWKYFLDGSDKLQEVLTELEKGKTTQQNARWAVVAHGERRRWNVYWHLVWWLYKELQKNSQILTIFNYFPRMWEVFWNLKRVALSHVYNLPLICQTKNGLSLHFLSLVCYEPI